MFLRKSGYLLENTTPFPNIKIIQNKSDNPNSKWCKMRMSNGIISHSLCIILLFLDWCTLK